MTDPIPAGSVPIVVPGGTDYVLGTQLGETRRFRIDQAIVVSSSALTALAGAGIYETTALGLAATSDGDYFMVPSAEDDEAVILYLNDSGSATEVKRYPSAEVVNRKAYPLEDDLVAPLGDISVAEMSRFLKDFKVLTGTRDVTRDYSIQRVRKNNAGVWEINLSSEVNNGSTPATSTVLARYRVLVSPEDSDNVTVHELSELSGSGVTAIVAVNWSALSDGDYTGLWAGRGYKLGANIWGDTPDPYGLLASDTLTARSNLYPFVGDPDELNAAVVAAIKDIVVHGYDDTGVLFFNSIIKSGTAGSNRIRLAEYKNGVTTNLCEFDASSTFLAKAGNQYIASNLEFSSSGVSFELWIDWAELATQTYTLTVDQSSLSDRVRRNERTLEQPRTTTDDTADEAKAAARSIAANRQFLARLQKITGDYNHILTYGQSLSVGNVAVPINTTADKNSKMIGDDPRFRAAADTTVLYDLVTGTEREPPGIQATRAFKDLMDGWLHEVADKQFVFTTNGEGGTSIELLSKGAPLDYYEDGPLATMTAMKAIADGEGATVRCPLIVWLQGEANMTGTANQNATQDGPATSEKAAYKALLETLMADLIADVKATYGQDADPLILMYVTNNIAGGIEAGVQMAQIEFCQENYNAFIFSPTYFLLTGADGTHPTANGYRWLGEYIGKAAHRALAHEQKPQWLGPRKIVLGTDPHGDNYVDVHFNVPVPPLQKNTETYPVVQRNAVDTLGFGVYDDGTEARISSVELFDTFARIHIQENYRFTTDVITVTYADSNVGLNAQGAGNLCDSDDFPAKGVFVSGMATDTRTPNYLDGTAITDAPYPLYNWCVPFSYNLNGVDSLVIE